MRIAVGLGVWTCSSSERGPYVLRYGFAASRRRLSGRAGPGLTSVPPVAKESQEPWSGLAAGTETAMSETKSEPGGGD